MYVVNNNHMINLDRVDYVELVTHTGVDKPIGLVLHLGNFSEEVALFATEEDAIDTWKNLYGVDSNSSLLGAPNS